MDNIYKKKIKILKQYLIKDTNKNHQKLFVEQTKLLTVWNIELASP